MRYYVICEDPITGKRSAFATDWYDYENLYNPEYKMIILDWEKDLISFDGKTWEEIEEDHL